MTKLYRVSRNTIHRDGKIADAIDAIGAVSPEAKRMLLSGELMLTKKELTELSYMSDEDLKSIALQIEEGKYEKRKPEPQTAQENSQIAQGNALPPRENAQTAQGNALPPQPVYNVLAGISQLDLAVSQVSDSLAAWLPKITGKKDKAQLRTALRSSIDTLEDWYTRI